MTDTKTPQNSNPAPVAGDRARVSLRTEQEFPILLRLLCGEDVPETEVGSSAPLMRLQNIAATDAIRLEYAQRLVTWIKAKASYDQITDIIAACETRKTDLEKEGAKLNAIREKRAAIDGIKNILSSDEYVKVIAIVDPNNVTTQAGSDQKPDGLNV
jgi:hypothetical protein